MEDQLQPYPTKVWGSYLKHVGLPVPIKRKNKFKLLVPTNYKKTRGRRSNDKYRNTFNGWSSHKASSLKTSASIRGIYISKDIDKDFISSIRVERCPVFGTNLVYRIESRSNNSASIDRIDNSRGYERDNIQIISDLANRMKNSASFDELEAFAKWVLSNVDNWRSK